MTIDFPPLPKLNTSSGPTEREFEPATYYVDIDRDGRLDPIVVELHEDWDWWPEGDPADNGPDVVMMYSRKPDLSYVYKQTGDYYHAQYIPTPDMESLIPIGPRAIWSPFDAAEVDWTTALKAEKETGQPQPLFAIDGCVICREDLAEQVVIYSNRELGVITQEWLPADEAWQRVGEHEGTDTNLVEVGLVDRRTKDGTPLKGVEEGGGTSIIADENTELLLQANIKGGLPAINENRSFWLQGVLGR